MPNSFTNKMFKGFLNGSYNPSASGQKTRIDPGNGIFLVFVQMRGNNNDHLSSHIFQATGVYVKSVTTLSNIDYVGNTSVTIEPAESGTSGFYITAKYTDNFSGVIVYIYKVV